MNTVMCKCTFCNCHVEEDSDTLCSDSDQNKISLFMNLLSTCSSFINFDYHFNSLPLCTKCEIQLTHLSELQTELERIKQEMTTAVSSLSMNIIQSVEGQQEEENSLMENYLNNDIIIQEFRNAVYSSFSPKVKLNASTKKRKRKKESSSRYQKQIKVVDFSKILEDPMQNTFTNYNTDMNTNMNMNQDISIMKLEPDMTYFLQQQQQQSNQNHLLPSSSLSIPEETIITGDMNMVNEEFINENTDADDEIMVMDNLYEEFEEDSSSMRIPRIVQKCTLCSAEFSRRRDLTRHFCSRQDPKLDPFPYKCPLENCSHQFKSLATLKIHEQQHQVPKLRCEDCGLGYGTAQALKSHQIKFHRGKELFPCNFCQQSFTRKSDCFRHIRFAHFHHPRSHKCYYCGEIFTSVQALQPHLTIHNAPPVYLCAMPGCAAAGICLTTPDEYRAHMQNYHSPGLNLSNTK